ncbi:MAG: hypothetical protein DME86_07230 [Verrucomicrobia bacterium]|nr:MAG: hypothetical protein DME86_07230 [Verrucomicrobiota bacterium]
MAVGVHSDARFQLVSPDRSASWTRRNAMKSPLILLFTRDGAFAQSVCDAVSGTDAVVLIALGIRDRIANSLSRWL